MATEEEGTCKLCGIVAPLQRSHIIPRSFYKRAKDGGSQLVVHSAASGRQPLFINADPRERLLCFKCEQHFSTSYERWGTRLFFPDRGQRNLIVDMGSQVKFKDFRYEDTYLFFLSILWRAGVSTLDDFKGVSLGSNLERWIAWCLKERTILLADGVCRMDNFIRLGIIKLVDRTSERSQEMLRRAIIGFGQEASVSRDSFIYYFGVGGFLVIFYFSLKPLDPMDPSVVRSAPRPGTRTFRAECVPVQQLTQIVDLFRSARTAGMPTRRRGGQ